MKTAFVTTFGCKVNQYDGQVMRDALERAGLALTADRPHADVVVINSCTVTHEADRQCRQLVRRIVAENKDAQIIVTGCYARRTPQELTALSSNVAVLPVGADIIELISKKSPKASLTAAVPVIDHFDGHSRAFVKVQDGCQQFCSYCIVPYVRSDMWSKPLEHVYEEVKTLVAKGYPEVVITGVRLGKYEHGLDVLIKNTLKIQGEFRIRLSSVDLVAVTDELLALMRDNPQRFCPHLHISLQSGSEAILKNMNRPYTVANYMETIRKVYHYLPDASINTDIIVGFPGETENDFAQSCAVAREAAFSRIHVFTYSAREGTAAAKMPLGYDKKTIQNRTKMMKSIAHDLQDAYIQRFIGKTRQAVLESGGVILTDNYIKALLSAPHSLPRTPLFPVRLSEQNHQIIATLE